MSGRAEVPNRFAPRLRLGHIAYSNCFPVHARLLDQPCAGDPALFEGVPSTLNGMLAAGEIDVAPSSSIEYALHSDRYRILPDLVIGSSGPVRSILFLSDLEPQQLSGRKVAVPTASATSVVLLKILLRLRWQVEASFVWFDQRTDDPFSGGADAALFIGDVALRADIFPQKRVRLDLGAEWWAHTGLPFAFAVWQAGSGSDAELKTLRETLLESRTYGESERARLAERYASHFKLDAALLEDYWSNLRYDLAPDMVEGLQTYYSLAAEIGAIPRVPEIRWIG
jgi:chorismate dehydratase